MKARRCINGIKRKLVEKNFEILTKIIDLISWSGRQKEWYFSEKRLLFATPSQVEREKWITVLNWINNESHL